jgi:hypothetical protein
MKLNTKTTGKNSEDAASCAIRRTQGANKPEASAIAGVPKRFRRLKWHELVSAGDFVADAQQGFELWEGPNGFRADAFVKPIYRTSENRSAKTKRIK